MDRGDWWAAVHGVAKSRTWLSNFTFTFYFHALEKAMATHSIVLAWRIPGTGEPGGLPSMGLHRVGHDWSNLAAVAAAGQCCECFTCANSFNLPKNPVKKVLLSSLYRWRDWGTASLGNLAKVMLLECKEFAFRACALKLCTMLHPNKWLSHGNCGFKV